MSHQAHYHTLFNCPLWHSHSLQYFPAYKWGFHGHLQEFSLSYYQIISFKELSSVIMLGSKNITIWYFSRFFHAFQYCMTSNQPWWKGLKCSTFSGSGVSLVDTWAQSNVWGWTLGPHWRWLEEAMGGEKTGSNFAVSHGQCCTLSSAPPSPRLFDCK